EGGAEGLEPLLGELEPGGGAVPAVAQQVLLALTQDGEQVHIGDAAARAPAAPGAVERDQDGWAVVAFDQARGTDADDPGVPALAPEHERRRLGASRRGGELPLGRGEHLLLRGAALAVGAIKL